MEVFVNYFLENYFLESYSLENYSLDDHCLGSFSFLLMLIVDLFDYYLSKNFLENYFLCQRVDLWEVWEVLKV